MDHFVSLLLLGLLIHVEALSCFKCYSLLDKSCFENEKLSSNFLTKCSAKQNYCAVISRTEAKLNKTFLLRGCVRSKAEFGCRLERYGQSCAYYCKSNNCNNKAANSTETFYQSEAESASSKAFCDLISLLIPSSVTIWYIFFW